MNDRNSRQTDVAYILAKLRIAGVDHLLLRAHRKWGDWSLVGGHVEPTDTSWLRTAEREAQEEMAPLRFGNDFEIVPLTLPESEWGPVPSRSAGGTPTRYRARWYLLRFTANPVELLKKLPRSEFALVPVSSLERFEPLSSVVSKVHQLLHNWSNLPLSWATDLDDSPLRVSNESAASA